VNVDGDAHLGCVSGGSEALGDSTSVARVNARACAPLNRNTTHTELVAVLRTYCVRVGGGTPSPIM
jgi:hypothetical protein